MSIKFPFKRLICLALVLFMVAGMMPVHVHAASDSAVDAAIIFSDLHTSSSDYKQSTVTGVMTAFKNAGLPISSVTSGGDAFSVNADSTKYTGDPTKITGYIQSVLGNVPVNYVWSDHDRYGTGIDQKSKLVYGAGNDGIYGTADDGNYYIYMLSMGDLCTYDRYNAGFNYTLSSNNRTSKGFTATVPEAIANFKAAAATLSKDRPLLIVSHQPLFDNRNDNGWAEDWCDAINEVAADMDVAFFYGHNHKYDSGSDYYYAKGSTMAVATRKLTSGKDWNYAYQTNSGYQYNNDLASVNKVLNFTHMCAGYLAPSSTGSTSSTTREGTAMAVTIYDDSIRFTTYNSKGIFTGSYAVDKTITRDHASSEPELAVSGTSTYFVGDKLDLSVIFKAGSNTEDVTSKASITGYNMNAAGDYTVQITYGDLNAEFAIQVREKVFRDAATGITAEVSVPSATSLTVNTLGTDSQAYLAVAALLSKGVVYDIQLANADEATITMPIPAGVADPVVYYVSADGKTVTKMEAVQTGNTLSFVTDRFACYVIGQDDRAPEGSDVVVGDAGYSFVKVAAGTLKDGYYQLQNNHTSKYLTSTKTSNKNRLNLESNGQNHVWYIKAVSGGYTVQYGGPSGQYLTFSHEKAAMSSTAQTIQFLNTNGYWGIGATSGSPIAYLAREGTSTSSTSVHGYASNDYKYPTDAGMDWNLYERVENQTTYSVSASNVHHYLGQNDNQVQLTYTLLANGAAGTLPAGGSWSFSTYKDTDGIVKNISTNGLITFNKVSGSCYVKVAYTWSNGSAYAYVKVTTEVDPNACDHEYTAVTVEATCTKDGSVTYTCDCGDSYVETIQATGHNYASVVTAPTCTKEGFTTYTCSNCGDSYTADQVAALGHSYKSVTVEATCTVNGSVTYTCACGDSYVETIKASGHNYKSVVTAPTCTKTGYTTYTCACGDTYTADEVKALGHNYKSVTVEATCTKDGSVTYTCSCGDTYTEVIKATGHDYKSVVTAPTCTEAGYTTYTCSCGDSYTADEVAALGHDYKAAVTAPTCTKEGYTTYTCSCGDSYTADEVAALGHNYKSVVTAPTCIKEGYTTYTCSCGDSYTAGEVAALGHDYKSVTVEATCTKDGSITYTCSCGESYKETIKALGHDYTAAVTAPTCTKEGYTTYTCATCGYSYKGDKVAALGHDYESVTVEATCTKDGSVTYTCHCGDTYTEVINATGHDYKTVVTAPTCTEAGYTTYTCSCGDTYVADEVKALGHSYKFVVVEATCTKDGSVTYTCSCGDTYTEVIKATGHTYASVMTAPTCTKAGYTTYTCSCGDTYVADEVAALGHNYKSVVTAPTCTKGGYTTYTCSCGDSYTADEVAALGHDYKSVVTAPTCTKGGYTTYTCSCGDTYTADQVAALGHDYKAVVTEPTSNKGGYTTYTCSCGDSYIGDETEALENSIVVGDAGYSFVKVAAGTLKDGYYQLQNNHTSKYLTSTKTSNQNRLNLDANGQNHIWYIKAVSGGYTVQYGGPSGQYLTFSHEKAAMSSTAQTIKFLNTNGYWGIGATSGNPAPFLARESTSSSSTSVHGYASNDYKYPGDVGMDWNLYERVENQTTYSVSASDVHHYLDQNDNQVQLTYALLANGTAGTLPAGGSWSFSISKDTEGIVKSISNNGVITFNKVAGSCYVKIAYTWSEGTVYAYVQVTAERDPNACDHAYTAVVTAPTCTEAGCTTYTCSNCGDTYVADEIAALGHDYKSVVTAPTCTEAGYTTYTCHCGDSYVADEVKALGHDYKSVTVEATCTVDGSVTYTCACGDTYTEVIKATGHDYKAVVTAPTCTEAGYTTYTCSCGDTYVADEVKALGHSYKTVTVEATCTVDGSVTYTCSCGDTYTEVIKATGHDYKTVVTAPTCTKAGYTTYTCSCGDSYTADEVAALGHDYKSVVTAPTCTKEGFTTYTCSNCGDSYTADQVAAKGHIYDAVVTAPTSNKGGYTTYTCACGDSYIGDETEALENSVVAGGTAYEEKTVYVRVDSFENGGKYILIGEDNVTGGKPIAYLNNSGSEGWETVSINSGSVTANGTTYSKGYIELDNAKAIWTASGSASNGFTLTNNGRYIGGTDANTLKSSSSDAVKVVYDASAVRLKTASGTTRYLYYSTYGSENWKWATSIDSSSSSRKMWIYKEVTVKVPVSAPATYTLEAADVQHILTDYSVQLQYKLLADGIAADLPDGGSYSFQVSQDTSRIIAGISDKGLITFNNVAGSCYVKITCAWNGGSVYKYVKVTTELDPNACDHVYTAVVTAPTCTEAGYTTYTCFCGDTYVAEEVAANGHKYESVTVDATCSAEGSVTYTCACGDSYVEIIKMIDHTYESTAVTAPTCTAEGYTTHICSSCGYNLVDSKVAALGHSYNCAESNGYLVYTCGICGDSYSEKIATFTQVSSIASGKQYVLTLFTNNKYYALSHANNQLSVVEISVSNGEITSDIAEDLMWNCKDNMLSYEKDGTTYYLYGKKSGPKGTVSVSTSSSTVSFASNKLKISNQYLRYSGGSLSLSNSATTVYAFTQK